VYLIFAFINRAMTKKVETSNYFGAREFYLGIPAGMIRFACMLLAALALLNAPFYTEEQIEAQRAADEKNFGGGMFSGNYFPHLSIIQRQVFRDSFTGPLIRRYLDAMLVSTAPDGSGPEGFGAPPKKQPVIHIGK
ncbi:MAG: hypothetical protein KGJ60_04960, partial [Verrucomicrobiota bacterium]|nr:hypothetical protein [Verrucomicrobiota bacterium]